MSQRLKHRRLRTNAMMSRLLLSCFACGLVILIAGTPHTRAAEPAVSTLDIQPGPQSSSPEQLVAAGDSLFFLANDGVHGFELWCAKGIDHSVRLVKDITPGVASTNIFPPPVALADRLYFVVHDSHNAALWTSDGTSAGTMLVTPLTTIPSELVVAGSTMYFIAGIQIGDYNGPELWASDGTAAGTRLVKDIYPGPAASGIHSLTPANDRVFFIANDGISGHELWVSDGTEAGTTLVKDIVTGPSDADPYQLIYAHGYLFFLLRDPIQTVRRLWVSDGTAAGTQLLSNELYFELSYTGGYPQFVDVNGTLFFAATDAAHGYELWKSDGTPTGTIRVADIESGSSGSYPGMLTASANKVFFQTTTTTNGRELWMSDGTVEGTVLVRDIYPGPASSSIANLVSVRGMMLFYADDGQVGKELWKSDGTLSGTVLLQDINPGSGGSFVSNGRGDYIGYFSGFTLAAQAIYFSAYEPSGGTELRCLPLDPGACPASPATNRMIVFLPIIAQ